MADRELDNLPPEGEKENTSLPIRVFEPSAFIIVTVIFQVFFVAIYAVWFDYPDFDDAAEQFDMRHELIRDVAIMIFFGFGYLMTFPRRLGYSAIGYTFMISSFVVQWSLILEAFFHAVDGEFNYFSERFPIGLDNILNGLFCAGSVMISYGAVLGKVTPLQLVIMAIIEPVFFWLNFFICDLKLHAIDIGGGYYIHIYGAYFGLAVCFFLTNSKVHKHPDNAPSYNSDLFAFAGTLFLWLLWPTFNSVIGQTGLERLRAATNTYISLFGATVITFVVSRLVSKGRFDAVHIQNASLAGGVVMGIASHLDIYPATALGMGILAGLVSTLGFKFLTPFLAKYAHLHDTCGVHNLHGIPGILGAILSIFATLVISQTEDEYIPEYEKGAYQPLIQLAATGISIGIALISGIFTGILLLLIGFASDFRRQHYYNDKKYWETTYDYDLYTGPNGIDKSDSSIDA